MDERALLALENVVPFGLRRRELDGVIPAGSLGMDLLTGVGGLPRGRVLEWFGPESVGKSTLALQAAAAVQRQGGTVAWIDSEQAFDPIYATGFGVELESMVLSRLSDGFSVFQVLERLVGSKVVDLVVVDSAAALAAGEDASDEDLARTGGSQHEMLASGLRRLSRALSASPTCVLFLNQIRTYNGFGYRETSAGGWGLKLHAAIRADLRRDSGGGDEGRLSVRVVKNQVAEPVQLNLPFVAGEGVPRVVDVVERALEVDVLRRENSGYWFGGRSLGDRIEEVIRRLQKEGLWLDELERVTRREALRGLRKPAGRQLAHGGAAEAVGRAR